MQAKYVNPFTDFGFKKIFGEEASKPQLIDFLNALLALPEKIVDLSFKNPLQQGQGEYDRKAVYDIYCESETGDKFIVELQKAKQNYFIDRTIYYSTFPIQQQAERGFWDFGLKAVYCIGILDFTFEDDKNKPEAEKEVVHTVQLKNQHAKVFYDRLTYVYVEMPNFTKTEEELLTRLDKWLYFLKHLDDFDTIPAIFKDVVFEQAFEKAEIAKMDETERARYEQSLKIARDNKNTFDYAMEQVVKEANEKIRQAEEQAKQVEKQAKQAEEQAEEQIKQAEERTRIAQEQARQAVQETTKIRLEEKAQTIRTARQMGLPIQAISQLTGLTEEEINSIG